MSIIEAVKKQQYKIFLFACLIKTCQGIFFLQNESLANSSKTLNINKITEKLQK